MFAVGECAEHRGRSYGLVAPLWEQTAQLADRLSGRNPDAVYTGSTVSTKLKVMGVDLAVMGDKEPIDEDDEVVSYSEPSRGIYKKLIVQQRPSGRRHRARRRRDRPVAAADVRGRIAALRTTVPTSCSRLR